MLYALSNGLGQHVHLDEVDHEKDLGVWFTSDLKPSLHCCKAAASAMKVLSMIRLFVNISKKLYNFIFLYKTYVRPHLEYCVPTYLEPRCCVISRGKFSRMVNKELINNHTSI